MTKDDLANALLHSELDLSKSQYVVILNNITEILTKVFSKHEDLFIRGLGSFRVVRRKGHIARNLSTGEQVKVPEQIIVKFKLSKILKEKLNETRN